MIYRSKIKDKNQIDLFRRQQADALW